jgi:two-component system sensor kinase FixL
MSSKESLERSLISKTILLHVLESLNDALITIDENHRVLFMNRAAEEMFGHNRSEILGRDSSPLIPPAYRKVHRRYVETCLRVGKANMIGETREFYVQHSDGHSFPVEISYSVSYTEGRPYLTGLIRDVTRRKESEREIRFTERLADTGKAVAQVVHEIRNPLMLIGGFARQLGDCALLKNDEKSAQKLTIIAEEVKRLEKLLSGLGLLTRPPESTRKLPVELNQLVQEISDLLETLVQNQQVNLELDLSEHPIEIRGDPDQLKQVFLNILQNALEATDKKGTIRVISRSANNIGRIAIEDSGPGIPTEIQEKIFDPFFTTKTNGTGLGLAISRSIIQDHGGYLILSSSPSRGTTFTVALPLEINESF